MSKQEVEAYKQFEKDRTEGGDILKKEVLTTLPVETNQN